MAERTRVGVVGCGLIAQVMHLPHVAELSGRYEIAALCGVSPELSGSHAPIAIAAAEAGKQPLCLSVAEGREMLAAAARIGSRLAPRPRP
jgi:predicted dehydrogenase